MVFENPSDGSFPEGAEMLGFAFFVLLILGIWRAIIAIAKGQYHKVMLIVIGLTVFGSIAVHISPDDFRQRENTDIRNP